MRRVRLTVLAISSFYVLRTAFRTAREIAALRQRSAALRIEFTRTRGVASGGGLAVHARIADHGPATLPPAVLVHGYGVGTTYFVPLAACLSRQMRVYAPDLPGHGRSAPEIRPLTISELAQALANWMDAQGLRSVLLVGHSLGCQVAAELAAGRPDLVAGLLLIGPTCDVSGRTLRQQLARLVLASVFERRSCIIWTLLDYLRAGRGVLVHEMQEMLTHRLEDVLPGINVPARIVRGSRDYVASDEWAVLVATSLEAPAPITIPGWGHAVQYDEPFAIARVALHLSREIVARAERRG